MKFAQLRHSTHEVIPAIIRSYKLLLRFATGNTRSLAWAEAGNACPTQGRGV
jgi:hypothetical protein